MTVSCAEGDTGFVYRGVLEVEVIDLSLDACRSRRSRSRMNVGNPELAFEFQRLPNEGVGLARLEFIIARMIGVHPQAVLAYPDLPADLQAARRGSTARVMPTRSRSTSTSWPRASPRWARRSGPSR